MTATDDPKGLAQRLADILPGVAAVEGLRRLTGGVSRETWVFEAKTKDGAQLLILRRTPGGEPRDAPATGLPLDAEARLVAAAGEHGVPVPGVRHVLKPDDGLGTGYVMEFVAGETIARRILRDARFDACRPHLARQWGEALARIHALPPGPATEGLEVLGAAEQLARYREINDGFGAPLPVFEAAFAWLGARLPPAAGAPHLVHGDFRMGNLLTDETGLAAVLDWELAHLGDPHEDLGWLSVPSWRFGVVDKPVGGVGTRQDLIAAYEAAGGIRVDRDRLRFWEVFGCLKWGVMCRMMAHAHLAGAMRSVERAAIGRRVSEIELDLVLMLKGDMP